MLFLPSSCVVRIPVSTRISLGSSSRGFFVFYERLDLKEDLDVCADAVEHCRESILKMIQEIENELNENEES